MDDFTDEQHWAHAFAGDAEGFGVIFDRHRQRVLRHSVALVPTAADADDVVAITKNCWAEGIEAYSRLERTLMPQDPREELPPTADMSYMPGLNGNPAQPSFRPQPTEHSRRGLLWSIVGIVAVAVAALLAFRPFG